MTTPALDIWRQPAVPAPDAPRKGMHFWVQEGAYWTVGQGYSISRVNGQSFYVASGGTTRRYPIASWRGWLAQRRREGTLLLEGAPVRPPQLAPLGCGLPTLPSSHDGLQETPLNTQMRDARIFRAVREVLGSYTIREKAEATPDGLRAFGIGKKTDAYVVTVDPAWQRPPRCTCPDASKRFGADEATFCKHAVAVLVSHEALRHQLIDFIL